MQRVGPAQPRLVETSALVISALWGANFIAVKAGMETTPPLAFASSRLLLGGLALFLYLGARGGGARVSRAGAGPLVGLGVAIAGAQGSLGLALHLGNVDGTALITATIPLLVVLISTGIRTDHLTVNKFAGLIVAFVGVLVIIIPDTSPTSSALGVDALAGVSAVFSACYISFVRPSLRRYGSLTTTAWTLTIAGALLFIPGLAQVMMSNGAGLTARTGIAMGYSAVIAAAIGSVVMFRAVNWIGPIRAGLFQFLVPLFAVAFAAIVDGERVAMPEIVGGACVGLGIVISRMPDRWYRQSPVPIESVRGSDGEA